MEPIQPRPRPQWGNLIVTVDFDNGLDRDENMETISVDFANETIDDLKGWVRRKYKIANGH